LSTIFLNQITGSSHLLSMLESVNAIWDLRL
jgi:hypothetical protein